MALSLNYLLSKIGSVSDPTRKKAIEIIKAAQAHGHVVRFVWGMGSSYEHATGRALDIMVNNEAAGDFVRNYVWENRKRLGLRHVIWEQHITSTVVSPGVRRRMKDRGDSTQNHYDHNHIFFLNNDAYQAPEKLVAPKPRRKPKTKKQVRVRLLRRGKKGADVRRLQSEMRRVFPAYAGRLAIDGDFGPNTERVIREYQRRARLSVDGVVGPNTRARLKKHGVRL